MNRENVYPLILLTHGSFGAEMIKSAEMIAGKLNGVYAFGLTPELSLSDYAAQIKSSLPAGTEHVIVLTDVAGASTSHAALLLSKEIEMIAFSGLNLDLLLEADTVRYTDLTWTETEAAMEQKASCCCTNLIKLLREIKI